MKNRIFNYPPAPRRKRQPSQPAFQGLRSLAQEQIVGRLRHVQTYVQEHPVTGVGAAFCIGIFVGWIIKRR